MNECTGAIGDFLPFSKEMFEPSWIGCKKMLDEVGFELDENELFWMVHSRELEADFIPSTNIKSYYNVRVRLDNFSIIGHSDFKE